MLQLNNHILVLYNDTIICDDQSQKFRFWTIHGNAKSIVYK